MTTSSDSSKGSSGFGKLRRGYRALALLLLNTVLFGLVGLWLIGRFADVSVENPHVYSKHFLPASYELSTPDEVRQIAIEFDEMGEQESFQFNPWTTFTERPFKGVVLNIQDSSSYPRRATVPPEPAESAGKEELLVWLFGGSTVLGWGVSDNNTIASHLQHKLQSDLPAYRIRVINHGHAYYISSQEVSLYIALLRKDERPDVVIFLDGLNEVAYVGGGFEDPYFTPQATAGWEAERQKRFDPDATAWFSVNASFPLHRLLRRFESAKPVSDNIEASGRVATEDVTGRIREVMRANRAIAHSVSDKLGIQSFFFLQPLPEWVMETEIFFDTYAGLREDAHQTPAFTDISTPLEQELEHPYVDKTHYSDKGSQLVARRIAEVIAASSKFQ